MEFNPNSGRGYLDPGNDFVNRNANRDQGDNGYFCEEGTGKGLAFGYQWKGDALSEHHTVSRSIDPNRKTSAVYEEDWLKSDDTASFIPKENVCARENGGVSFIAWEAVPVSNLEDQMKENVKVKGLQNANVKVLGNRRGGFKICNINVNDETEDFRIPTSYNPEAFLDAESDQTFECSESLKPNSFGKIEVKHGHASPVVDSFCNSTEFVGKRFPDSEETSNKGDESQKVKVAMEKPSSNVGQNATTVQKGHALGLKVLNSMSKTCTEKVGNRVDLGKARRGAGAGGEPASNEPPRRKNRKNKAQKKMASRIDTMNANPASHVKSAGERSYRRGIIPITENMFPKNVRPANDICNSRGFRPASEQHLLGRGVHSASENVYGVDVKSASGNSCGRDGKSSIEHLIANIFHPTSENHYSIVSRPISELSYIRCPYPANDNSYGNGRGFNPSNENLVSKGLRQACEMSRGKVFRPSCENSSIQGFGPPSEQFCVKDAPISHLTTGNWSAQDNQPASMNLSRPRNTALMSIAERGEFCFKDAPISHLTTGNWSAQDNQPASMNLSRPRNTALMSIAERGEFCFKDAPISHLTTGNWSAQDNQPASMNLSRPRNTALMSIAERGEFCFKDAPISHLTTGNWSAQDNQPASMNLSRPRNTALMSIAERGEFCFKDAPISHLATGNWSAKDNQPASMNLSRPRNTALMSIAERGEFCFKDAPISHLATGNWSAQDNQPASMNLSRPRNTALMSTIAEREERSSYPNTLQATQRYCLSQRQLLMPRRGRSVMPTSFDHHGSRSPVPTAYPAGPRKVAVVKPRPKEMEMFSRKVLGPQTECDFIEMVLTTDNMFDAKSSSRKTWLGYEKHGFLDEGGTNLQRGVANEWPTKGRGEFNSEVSAEGFGGFNGGGQQWNQSGAGQHPDCYRISVGQEESEEMEPPLQLKHVNWVGKEDIGHFFVSGLRTNLDVAGYGQSGCHSQCKFLTFDELVKLDGLETAIVSITDPIETIVAKGFVARFPGSCSLHLLVNEDDRIYPEYIIVCCSCPKPIIAHQIWAVMSCPKCRFVRLSIYPEMKIKCQFMLLKSAQMLRFVLVSSSTSICEWENRVQFGWFHDFLAVHKDQSNCIETTSAQQHATPFSKDLTEFLTSMQISDLNVLSGIDFSNVSPAVRLIHTKPGVSYTNDSTQYGASQLQKILKNLIWKSTKKKQSLYKTERIDQRGYSILNDVFPNALSGNFQSSIKRVKVVFPSFRWVNECLENCESRERLKLLSAVGDINSFGDLPFNFLNDLHENEDFVQNYNVLEQYETWEESGKMRKYGWCLTGSQALDTESWGDDYPVYHKVVYKHFQLSVGLFPYLRRKEHLKEFEVCAVDLCDVPLPFDPVAVVRYRQDDMPYLVLGSGQNVFCHCVGVFNKSRGNFGFIRPSPLFDGYLEPFPAASPGPRRPDVFLHLSSLSLMEMPREGSVVEFFVLNQPPSQNHSFIKVCCIFSSISEAKRHFLSTIPRLGEKEKRLYKEMVQAKVVALGIEWTDNTKQMEEAIEGYYNSFLSSQRRGFSYFPTHLQIDAISSEPVKILNDTDWVRDHYKNRQNWDGLPHDIGGCRPRVLLANFQALKYRLVKGLREVEEWNQRLE